MRLCSCLYADWCSSFRALQPCHLPSLFDQIRLPAEDALELVTGSQLSEQNAGDTAELMPVACVSRCCLLMRCNVHEQTSRLQCSCSCRSCAQLTAEHVCIAELAFGLLNQHKQDKADITTARAQEHDAKQQVRPRALLVCRKGDYMCYAQSI